MKFFSFVFKWLISLAFGYKTPKIKKNTILVIYFDCGGGHLMTAKAIKDSLVDHDVHIRSFNEVFPHLPWSDNFYNFGLKTGHIGRLLVNINSLALPLVTFGNKWLFMIPPLRWVANQSAWEIMNKINPSEIISCMTCTNGIMSSVFKRVNPDVKYNVMCSDFEDPYGSWDGGTYDRFIVGTDKLEKSCSDRGHNSTIRIPGVLLRPQWYEEVKVDRRYFGFEDTDHIVGIFYGGIAPDDLLAKMHLFGPTGILIAGKNKRLASSVRLKYPYWKVYEYVEVEMLKKLLKVMDVMIGKPGPGSISEAIVSGTPLILENIGVMYQERSVLEYVIEKNLGRSFSDWSDVPYLLFEIPKSNQSEKICNPIPIFRKIFTFSGEN